MKPGPRPKPTKLKVVAGNPGRRPLPKDEPRPRKVKPRAPQHLDAVACKEWARLAPELYRMGLLTGVDRTALAAYCQCFSRWSYAEKKIQEDIAESGEMLITSPNGQPQQSPYVSIANRAMELMHKFLTEFGMTPSSRTRVSVAKGSTDPDADEIFGPD